MSLDQVDQTNKLGKSDYETQMPGLQLKMLRLQRAYQHTGQRAVIVFEGWDAAGKGGAIRRITQKLDPRGFAVYPIGAPVPEDQARHYLFRFWKKIPKPGMLAIFDRSWYGRVLVERVEGLTPEARWQAAYEEINQFEHQLIDDGARVIKIFLHITKEEQAERFKERIIDPYKRWKITGADIRNHDLYDNYKTAIDAMLAKTSPKICPWNVIGANNKKWARVAVLNTLIRELSHNIEIAVPPLDPEVLAVAKSKFGLDNLQL